MAKFFIHGACLVLRYETFILKQFTGGYLKVLAQSMMHLTMSGFLHLNSFLFMDVKLLVIQVVHRSFASSCKCMLIVPIKLRGIIPFLYSVIPMLRLSCLVLKKVYAVQSLKLIGAYNEM